MIKFIEFINESNDNLLSLFVGELRKFPVLYDQERPEKNFKTIDNGIEIRCSTGRDSHTYSVTILNKWEQNDPKEFNYTVKEGKTVVNKDIPFYLIGNLLCKEIFGVEEDYWNKKYSEMYSKIREIKDNKIKSEVENMVDVAVDNLGGTLHDKSLHETPLWYHLCFSNIDGYSDGNDEYSQKSRDWLNKFLKTVK
jgi:hypothetical protein